MPPPTRAHRTRRDATLVDDHAQVGTERYDRTVMQAALIAVVGALAGIVAIARAAAHIPAAVPVRVRQRRGTRVVR